MYSTEKDGIVFIEGSYEPCRKICQVSVRIQGYFLGQAQLKSLDDVKKEMARRAKRDGGNAVIEFKYGQRSTFWTTLLGLDDVSWYGDGYVAELPRAAYEKLASGRTD